MKTLKPLAMLALVFYLAEKEPTEALLRSALENSEQELTSAQKPFALRRNKDKAKDTVRTNDPSEKTSREF